MSKYKVANISFKIDLNGFYQSDFLEKFKSIDSSIKYNFTIEIFFGVLMKYGIKKYEIINSDLYLFSYRQSFLLVDKNWECIRLLSPIKTENIDTFLIQVFHTHAVRNHMIQVHSSLIEYKNNGIMFLGPSGIGKTTQAELWHQYLDALIINGDMVFVEDKGDEFIGWGTPWHGSSPYCENTSVPVKALVVLKQGQENRIRKLEGFEKVSEVSNNIIYPMWIEDGMDLCLETLDHLLTHIPVYELVNKADEDSVLMVKQVVFDEKN